MPFFRRILCRTQSAVRFLSQSPDRLTHSHTLCPVCSSRAGIKTGHRLIRVNNVSAPDLRHEELIVVAQQKERELDLLIRVSRSEELRIMTSFMMAPRRVSKRRVSRCVEIVITATRHERRAMQNCLRT